MVPVPYDGEKAMTNGAELSTFVCPSCSERLTLETGRMICAACGRVLKHGAD